MARLPRIVPVLTLLASLGAAACDPGETGSPTPLTFRVGVLALMEGPMTAISGLPTLEGARMAAEEINAAGGVVVDGHPRLIELIDVQHRLRVEDVTTAARDLINRDSVHVLLGPQLSQHAIPVGAVAERAGVPMISPMSSNPATTQGRRYVFRMAFLDRAQSRVLAQIGRERLGLERVGVVSDRTSPYSQEVSARFVESFRALGGQVVESSFPGGGPPAWRRAFSEVLAAAPERVLLPLQTEQVLEFMRLVEEEGLDVGALQWMWTVPEPRARDFVDRYRRTYGEPPRSTAALTYDALHLFSQAAAAAGSLDGIALRDAIRNLDGFQGVTGPVEFDDSGDPTRKVVVSRIDENGATYVTSVDAG
ncbi:MAG: ABC transporter substrate-binding protein [Gemmatimonadota bacterium]